MSVLVLLFRCRRPSLGWVGLGVCGAVSHNIGQMLLARLFTNAFLFYYLPVLLVSGVIMGTITGRIVASLLPYWERTSAFLGTGTGFGRRSSSFGAGADPSQGENIK